jgi:hypothetical protein
VPEATLAIPSATLPFEVVPSATACEPLEFLTELIHDGLNRHQSLSRTLAANVIDSAENCVRIGWALSDARTYLAQPGSYQKWMGEHFGQVSSGWLLRLRKLSAAFSRDLVDVKQRERLGVTVEGLPAVTGSVHLRTQLADAAPRSLNHLFRMTGVLAPAPSDATGGKKARISAKVAAIPARRSALSLQANAGRESLEDLQQQLNTSASQLMRLDPAGLSLDESTELMNWLQPFVEYHRGLLVRIL